ncbi:uncharacterized protein LOC143359257 [Halictus rubicundus]|uniref:uncharacterized protein LOC143359257 n=1 Tax=Halictus rubicundus TaxID=77578 RepID=UPI004035B7F3
MLSFTSLKKQKAVAFVRLYLADALLILQLNLPIQMKLQYFMLSKQATVMHLIIEYYDPRPIPVVQIDRPFFYAILHKSQNAQGEDISTILFSGHITVPLV